MWLMNCSSTPMCSCVINNMCIETCIIMRDMMVGSVLAIRAATCLQYLTTWNVVCVISRQTLMHSATLYRDNLKSVGTHMDHAGVARTCSALLALRKGLNAATGERQASAWPSLVSTEKGMPSCHASTVGSSACSMPESVNRTPLVRWFMFGSLNWGPTTRSAVYACIAVGVSRAEA